MNNSVLLRRVLLAPAALRSSLLPVSRPIFHPSPIRQFASAPSIAQHSFWVSLIPKPLRKGSSSATKKKKIKSKEWNPATFFIIIFLFIGSMSIQMIALRNEFAAFTRRADAKISLLKEIIERIKNGEEVDVEGLLGTGDPQREMEWEEVLLEIEQEDAAWEESRRQKNGKNENVETIGKTEPILPDPPAQADKPKPKPTSKTPSEFY
ncbi:hypothetical protein B0J14DRAFT_469924 [Halenospora varia]|nr:hypothetical protein B0J14DRAFT_469924 [Halenospora varia]